MAKKRKSRARTVLKLNNLKVLIPGLRKTADFLQGAAEYCLDAIDSDHEATFFSFKRKWLGNRRSVKKIQVVWTPIEHQDRFAYGDKQESTEWGAVGVGLLLLHDELKFNGIMRSHKGTGVDYFISEKKTIAFQEAQRVEFSGTLRGDVDVVRRTLKAKLNQTKASDDLGTNAYAVIVGFEANLVSGEERCPKD